MIVFSKNNHKKKGGYMNSITDYLTIMYQKSILALGRIKLSQNNMLRDASEVTEEKIKESI